MGVFTRSEVNNKCKTVILHLGYLNLKTNNMQYTYRTLYNKCKTIFPNAQIYVTKLLDTVTFSELSNQSMKEFNLKLSDIFNENEMADTSITFNKSIEDFDEFDATTLLNDILSSVSKN